MCGIYNSISQLVITATTTLLSHCITMQSHFGKLFKLWEIWPSSSKDITLHRLRHFAYLSYMY